MNNLVTFPVTVLQDCTAFANQQFSRSILFKDARKSIETPVFRRNRQKKDFLKTKWVVKIKGHVKETFSSTLHCSLHHAYLDSCSAAVPLCALNNFKVSILTCWFLLQVLSQYLSLYSFWFFFPMILKHSNPLGSSVHHLHLYHLQWDDISKCWSRGWPLPE